MNTLQPNKHARFETRYAVEIVNAVNILLRQHIGLDPMPSYRSIARLVEATYPVAISGTTVKRMLDKLKCTAPLAGQISLPLTPNDTNENQSPKSGVAAEYADKDGKSCNLPTMDVYC